MTQPKSRGGASLPKRKPLGVQIPLFALPAAAPPRGTQAALTFDVTRYAPGDRVGEEHTVYTCRCGKPAILVDARWAHEISITHAAKKPTVIVGCSIGSHTADEERLWAKGEYQRARRSA